MNITFWRPLPNIKDGHSPPFKGWHAKKITSVLLCLTVMTPHITPAHAGVFDPLLKILLPFYKKNTDDEPVSQSTDTSTDGLQDTQGSQGNSTIPDDLPSVLLDDSLFANDSTPAFDKPDLYALLTAEFAADRGNIKQALNIYKTESFKANSTAIFERALSLSIEYETPKESLAFATAWQVKNPEHIPAWFYVTHLALKANDYDKASQMLAMILRYDPNADLTQIFENIFPTNAKDQETLLSALRKIDSDNTSVAALRSGLLMRLGDYEASLFHINNALKAEPNNLAFINLKLDILSLANQTDELWQFLHAKQQALPHETSLYLYEIRHLINQGDLKNAWQLLLTANKNTHNPDVILLAGLVGLDIGEYRHSIELLTPLIKNPDFASQAHYYLGIGYERLGDALHARQHYEKVRTGENVLDARTKVVGFYLLDNNVAAAMSTLIRLRDEYPIYATDSYLLEAEIRLRQGNLQAAKDILATANHQNPDDDRLLFASYELLENELTQDEQQDIITRLIRMDEHNPRYQLAQAKLNLHKNPDDQNALATAKTLSQIPADDPSYDTETHLGALLLLGENALHQGHYQTVLSYLQAPYEVSLDLNAGILLVRAYQGLGDDEMVKKTLSQLQSKYGFDDDKTKTNITQLY